MSNMSLSLIVSLIDQYSAGAAKFKQTLTGMRDQARQFGGGLKDGIKSELYPRFNVDAFDKNLKTMESRVSQTRSRLMGAGAQLLALAAPVKLAADFDQAFKSVEKVVDAPKKKLEELRKFALDTSALIPVAAKDILDLMSAAAQGGVPVADLERFTSFVARMAVAADMAGGEIGQIFAETRNTYKLTQEGIEALGDSANHLSNNMATSARKIFDFTGRASGGASLLKWTAVQVNAVGAAMTAVGIVPETAARGFNTFATKLLTGGKKVDSAFKSVGLSRTKVLADVRERGPQAFAEFIELLATKGDKGAAALADIVGLDFADDFNKLLANPDVLKQALALINDPANYKGSGLEEYEKQAEGAVAQFDTLKNKLTRAAILVGEQLLPPLLEVADMIGNVADQVSLWAGANPELFATIVKVVAGLMLMSASLKVLSFIWAVSGLQLFKLLGLFLRFNKAGRNVSLAARALRGLGFAMRGLSPLKWASLIPKLSWLLFVPRFAWRAVITPLIWAAFLPRLAWSAAIGRIGWAALAGKLSWRQLVQPLKWVSFIPKLSWLLFVPRFAWRAVITPLIWATFLPRLAWSAAIGRIGWAALAGKLSWRQLVQPLKWVSFIPKLSWLLFAPRFAWRAVITPLIWATFLPKLAWSAAIGRIGWAALAGKLSWRQLVQPLKWVSFIPKLSWLLFVPRLAWRAVITPLIWATFLPKLAWSAAIGRIGWAALAGKLSWRLLVLPLKWGARFIPVIGWAMLAGELAWHLLIKPLGWDKYLNMESFRKLAAEIKATIAGWFSVGGGNSDTNIPVREGQKNAVLEDITANEEGSSRRTGDTSIPVREDQQNSVLDGIIANAEGGDGAGSGPSGRLGRRRSPDQAPVPKARPAPAGAIPVPRPASFNEVADELSKITQAFANGGRDAGDAVDAGGDKAADAIRRAGPESGAALGQAAGGELRSHASAIGAEIGRVAVAEMRAATVNIRVQATQQSAPAGRGAIRKARAAALHDGGDD
jgi:TP901 family phage tail tape measure protein